MTEALIELCNFLVLSNIVLNGIQWSVFSRKTNFVV